MPCAILDNTGEIFLQNSPTPTVEATEQDCSVAEIQSLKGTH